MLNFAFVKVTFAQNFSQSCCKAYPEKQQSLPDPFESYLSYFLGAAEFYTWAVNFFFNIYIHISLLYAETAVSWFISFKYRLLTSESIQ